MTAQELKKDLDRRTEEASALAQLWAATIGTAPEHAQFFRWLGCYGFDTMRASIERTATKFAQLNGAMDSEYQRKYCTSVAKNEIAHSEATRRKHNYPYVEQVNA
jgi:hypothetical protein